MELDKPKEPLRVNPEDPVSIEAKIGEIYDENGPLAQEAKGDAIYLDLLRRAAVQDLAILVSPDRDDTQEAHARAHKALAAYEDHKTSTARP